MDKLTPESIRRDFVLPLMNFATALGGEADAINKDILDGINNLGFLPLEAKMGRNALGHLEKLLDDIRSRRKQIKNGLYRFREARNEQLKEERKKAKRKL